MINSKLRIWTAWLLYWIGDGISRLDGLPLWHRWGHPIYQHLMLATDYIQGDLEGGPWSPIQGP